MIKAKKNKTYKKSVIYELFAYLLKLVTYPNNSDINELDVIDALISTKNDVDMEVIIK